MIRYAITAGVVRESGSAALLASAQRWAEDAVNFVQLREKHLPDRAVLLLAQTMVQRLRSGTGSSGIPRQPAARTRLLVNGRPDVAAAARADGVHLTSSPGELTGAQVRSVYAAAGLPAPVVSISCHNLDQVQRARDGGVDLILFGPIFEKRVSDRLIRNGQGLQFLERACRAAGGTPLLALGGVTHENAAACLSAGAAGIAAIRLFSGDR